MWRHTVTACSEEVSAIWIIWKGRGLQKLQYTVVKPRQWVDLYTAILTVALYVGKLVAQSCYCLCHKILIHNTRHKQCKHALNGDTHSPFIMCTINSLPYFQETALWSRSVGNNQHQSCSDHSESMKTRQFQLTWGVSIPVFTLHIFNRPSLRAARPFGVHNVSQLEQL